MHRQIVLDTETTGLDPAEGHRIIEIGCVELVDRRATGQTFHQYVRPDREIESGAVDVHGITAAFLQDKPRFPEIAADFIKFVGGAELVIHNAPFDVGFINHELRLMEHELADIAAVCEVLDTLALARRMHPGQKNSLDALCRRYAIDNSQRDYHGALLDARILADVYLAMTGGQAALLLDAGALEAGRRMNFVPERVRRNGAELRVITATPEEAAAHEHQLDVIDKASDGQCIWRGARALPDD